MYGDKTDYPKIEIFVNGNYVATTTWAKSIKQARQKYALKRCLDLSIVSAEYK